MQFFLIFVLILMVWPGMARAGNGSASNLDKDSANNSAHNSAHNSAWLKRCEGQDCEIVQRLIDQQTDARVLEVAIGFPGGFSDDSSGDSSGDFSGGAARARGVVILPLGVDLLEPLTLQIDEGAPVSFKVRYCLGDGCYAFLSLPSDILEAMKTGKAGVLHFKTFDGEDGRLPLALEGFSAGIKSLTP